MGPGAGQHVTLKAKGWPKGPGGQGQDGAPDAIRTIENGHETMASRGCPTIAFPFGGGDAGSPERTWGP